MKSFNTLLDRLSNFFAQRKGLLPLIGLILVLADTILQFLPSVGWLANTGLLLHLGVILTILGLMLAWAL